MAEEQACQSESLIGSMKASNTASATTAKTGGHSSYSAEPDTSQAGTHESAEPAEANGAQSAGWRLDGAPVLGHRVVRSAVLEGQDLHVVLSAGDTEDGGPTSFEIPASVIHWLQTGEVVDV